MIAFLLILAAQQQCGASGVQSELNECAAKDHAAADAAMNAQWKITLARFRADDKANGPDSFGPPAAEILLKSQRAWLAYRDAQCALAGQVARGGSMQPMLESGCLASLTTERTQALKDAIETR